MKRHKNCGAANRQINRIFIFFIRQ